MSPSRRQAVAFTGAALLVAAAGLVVVYWGQASVGLYYDDYHVVRPWTALELRHVWVGSWDPTGIEVRFFRPLTAWLYAARFWLFGLNAPAMHALSLAGDAICAVLVAWIVRRETMSRPAAIFAAWIYAIHPSLPYAQVSWLTNQMHLAESLIVLTAILVWQAVRDRPIAWWAPLAPLVAAAFLFKEDGLMLAPALAAMTVVSDVIAGRPRKVRRWIAVAAAASAATAALAWFRQTRLHQIGGYGMPSGEAAWTNLLRGLKAVLLLWPTKSPWQAIASLGAMAAIVAAFVAALVAALRSGGRLRGHPLVWFAGVVALAGLALNVPALTVPRAGGYPLFHWQAVTGGLATAAALVGPGIALWRRDHRSMSLLGVGFCVAVVFNLPFLLVSKREQYHLLALGGVLVLTGTASAIGRAMSTARARQVAAATLVVATVPLAIVARQMAADFRPCAPPVLAGDQAALGWAVVPDEVKAWIRQKDEACATGRAIAGVQTLPVATWGVYGEEMDGPTAFRWTSDRVVLLLRPTAQAPSPTPQASWNAFLRRGGPTANTPVRVTWASGGAAGALTLTAPDWTPLDVPARSTIAGSIRGAELIEVTIAPWFIPADVDPQSRDLRRFGIELR